jgi:hypothetical protein
MRRDGRVLSDQGNFWEVSGWDAKRANRMALSRAARFVSIGWDVLGHQSIEIVEVPPSVS